MNNLERFFNEKINKSGELLDEDTRKAYEFDIYQCLEYLNKTEIEVTAGDISRWFGRFRNEYAPKSMFRKCMALKSYFKFLTKVGILDTNPTDEMQNFKPKPLKEKVALTTGEIDSMVKQARTKRDKAILLTLIGTGLRISELINLTLDDISSEPVMIKGKGDKIREIFLSDNTKKAIQEYLPTRHDTNINNLFVSNQGTKMREQPISNMLKMLAKRGGVNDYERVSPHLFRATFATLLSNKGVPIPTIQKILGHGNITTTMLYIKVNNSQVKNAMCIDIY